MTEETYLQDEDKPSEAEQAFSSTTSKKNLSGVRGRASRTGRKGAVMTPVDFLRGKDKKAYMQNSEVKVYNMYEEKVMPYEEFKELPIEKQVVLMTKWRDEVGTNNIIKDMKISRKKFYSDVLKSLGIETKPRGRRPKKETEETSVTARTDTEASVELTPTASSGENTFIISFNGRLPGHALANRLARLARIIDGDGTYEINVEVRETNTV
ncbi:hypothetical protein [Dethiobacter alkaliphilus]|uniref:hypothetical protein n=1 Tax=Dethiobacter alkaliphilus TaxID=427926 RepID=UPI0022276F90|nr:hypothetical protein [Dethiobacter alkaliphilus]MCW3489674.1 hypothetical protein [Dethiobacter alkaliphilus]